MAWNNNSYFSWFSSLATWARLIWAILLVVLLGVSSVAAFGNVAGWGSWVTFHMVCHPFSRPAFAALQGRVRAVYKRTKAEAAKPLEYWLWNSDSITFATFSLSEQVTRQAQIQGVNLDRRNYKELMALFNPAQVHSLEGYILGYLWEDECGEAYVVGRKHILNIWL